MSSLHWEIIDDYHKRASVVGGWLVKAYEDVYESVGEQHLQRGYNWNIAMTFVPDLHHVWAI